MTWTWTTTLMTKCLSETPFTGLGGNRLRGNLSGDTMTHEITTKIIDSLKQVFNILSKTADAIGALDDRVAVLEARADLLATPKRVGWTDLP
jgi:hypothetical protein